MMFSEGSLTKGKRELLKVHFVLIKNHSLNRVTLCLFTEHVNISINLALYGPIISGKQGEQKISAKRT